jgi:hypothetical protein
MEEGDGGGERKYSQDCMRILFAPTAWAMGGFSKIVGGAGFRGMKIESDEQYASAYPRTLD